MTAPLFGDVLSSAARISACGRFRYLLERLWSNAGHVLVVIMLNPSTADAATDDPTIRRVSAFAKAEGFAGIRVLNLYAFRASDPEHLWGRLYHALGSTTRLGEPSAVDRDVVGPDNGPRMFADVIRYGTAVRVAWGAGPPTRGLQAAHQKRVDEVAAFLRGVGVAPTAWGLTAQGHPRHPLYLPKAARTVPWVDGLAWSCSECGATTGAVGPACIHETCTAPDGAGVFGWWRPKA